MGYMQPLGEDLEAASFMLIEYPVGCWYCEMPEITGILRSSCPPGRATAITRGRLRIEGKLTINSKDPEDFSICHPRGEGDGGGLSRRRVQA